ncbi:MAG: hypothetical protein B7733_00340 [Myxococcales bacterium FL481]|nr:MAG: hypothetical protein B7733_00340 [Myxococcales bacterium FL481]
MLSLLVGTAVGAGTFLWAKNKRRESTGSSAVAGVATGAASAAAVALVSTFFWPIAVLGAAGTVYYLGRSRGQKALKPGSE